MPRCNCLTATFVAGGFVGSDDDPLAMSHAEMPTGSGNRLAGYNYAVRADG